MASLPHSRWLVDSRIMRRKDASLLAKAIWLRLRALERTFDSVEVAHKTLAEEVGCSLRAEKGAVDWLREHRWIKTDYRHSRTLIWRTLQPPDEVWGAKAAPQTHDLKTPERADGDDCADENDAWWRNNLKPILEPKPKGSAGSAHDKKKSEDSYEAKLAALPENIFERRRWEPITVVPMASRAPARDTTASSEGSRESVRTSDTVVDASDHARRWRVVRGRIVAARVVKRRRCSGRQRRRRKAGHKMCDLTFAKGRRDAAK